MANRMVICDGLGAQKRCLYPKITFKGLIQQQGWKQNFQILAMERDKHHFVVKFLFYCGWNCDGLGSKNDIHAQMARFSLLLGQKYFFLKYQLSSYKKYRPLLLGKITRQFFCNFAIVRWYIIEAKIDILKFQPRSQKLDTKN